MLYQTQTKLLELLSLVTFSFQYSIFPPNKGSIYSSQIPKGIWILPTLSKVALRMRDAPSLLLLLSCS